MTRPRMQRPNPVLTEPPSGISPLQYPGALGQHFFGAVKLCSARYSWYSPKRGVEDHDRENDWRILEVGNACRHAKPVLDDLDTWVGVQLTRISGKTPLAQAIRYAITRIKQLRPHLDHGFLELDNNTAERGMRAIAIGWKNWLFARSERGGRSAAIAYTLIETAKLNALIHRHG